MTIKQPIDRNGMAVTVGNNLVKENRCETIIRVDSNTEQVWYKNGGFDWFEEMKHYVLAPTGSC